MRALNKNLGALSAGVKDGSRRLKNVAFVFFLLFLFFLPLYEAPKNIFSVLFVFLGGWVAFYRENAAQRFKSKDLVAWAFLLLAISPFVAGCNSPDLDLPARLSSALNWALMPLVAVVMLLVRFSNTHLTWALRSLCLGSVISIGEAFYSWAGTYPELNSVGHVNQSALYLAFCLIPARLLVLRDIYKFDIYLGVAVILAVFSFQGPARSMVGFGASLACVGGMWIIYCWNRNLLKMLVGSLVVGFATILFLVGKPPEFFGPYAGFKQEFDSLRASQTNPYSQRDRLLNVAIEVAGDSLVGFGLGSFGSATEPEKVRKIVEAEGRDWADERGNYFFSVHGHNLFANLLVERGWIGVASIVIFLLCMLVRFSRSSRVEDAQVGMLTVAVICLAGLGQSTLHVEHGQLVLVCLGLCLAFLEMGD